MNGAEVATNLDTSVPVLLLGGRENSLAITRHLGRYGIAVRVSGESGCCAMHSRFCRESFPVPHGKPARDHWRDLLLDGGNRLHGHVVFACNDLAVEFLADYYRQLEPDYLLDHIVPDQQHAMLDKLRTLELAHQADVPAPRFWRIRTPADIERIRGELDFPVMVKPLHSHRFAPIFHCKLFIIESSFDELAEKIRAVQEHDLEVMVVEMIPGPDHLLSSYYTYMDASGEPLFHFTKRIVRRYPTTSGLACCHMTEWLPETAELGRRFFRGIGFRGMGNIEFKRDRRDDRLKIIEVNPRFTAAHILLVNAGLPVDLIAYRHLTGQPLPSFEGYEQFRQLWHPFRDVLSFGQLRARGEITLPSWLRSVARTRTDLPLWSMSDPMPCFAGAIRTASMLRERLK